MANIIDIFKGAFSTKGQDQTIGSAQEAMLWKSMTNVKETSVEQYARDFNGYLYPVIMSIVDEFANLKVKLVVGEDAEVIKAHPALTSLHEANNGMTYSDLLMWYAMFMEFKGENFWYLPKAKASNFRQINVLNPFAIVNIKFDKWGMPQEYEYKLDNGNTEKFDGSEVIFDKMPNPVNMLRGKSPVTGTSINLDIRKYALDYNKNFFFNNATPDTILKLAQGTKVSPETKNKILSDWSSRYRGVNKAHQPAILEGGIDIQTISPSLRDMAFGDTLKETKEGILANWRVSKTVIGQGEDVNRATAETEEYIFAKRVLTPLARRFTNFLTEKYLPLFIGREEILQKEYRFVFEDLVDDDVERDATVANIGLAGKQFMTINEARGKIGLEKLKGEEYDNVPVSTLPQPTTPEPKPEDEPKDDEDDAKQLELKKKELVTKKLKALKRKYGKSWQGDWYEQYLALQESWTKTYIKKFTPYFEAQADRVIASLKKEGNVFNVNFDTVNEQELAKQEAYKILSSCVREFWDLADEVTAGNALPPVKALKKGWELTPEIDQLIWEQCEALGYNINQNTRDDIYQVLSEAIQGEYSIDKVKRMLREYFVQVQGFRIETIARTEINTTASLVQHYRYQQARDEGLLDKIQWLTTLDGRERQGHREMYMKSKGIDELWTVPVYDSKGNLLYEEPMSVIRQPDATEANRINCRCAEIPVLE